MTLRIGQLAKMSGRTQSSIRYYEAQGLLGDVERAQGRRDFPESAVETMRVIDVAQRAGFSLAEIRELLAEGSRASSTLARLATTKAGEVTAEIADLRARHRWLRLASGCECAELTECRLFVHPACASP